MPTSTILAPKQTTFMEELFAVQRYILALFCRLLFCGPLHDVRLDGDCGRTKGTGVRRVLRRYGGALPSESADVPEDRRENCGVRDSRSTCYYVHEMGTQVIKVILIVALVVVDLRRVDVHARFTRS